MPHSMHYIYMEISIHAPTRGATLRHGTQVSHVYFNPRSHERSDFNCIVHSTIFLIFQSTLPREERLYFTHWFSSPFLISIHAPTRGATSAGFLMGDSHDFNPRSHERSDVRVVDILEEYHYFNPRSHERSDVSSL